MTELQKATRPGESAWGELEFPSEFINFPEGKMPLEIYIKKYPVTFKVRYDQTKEKMIHTAPPSFEPETTSVDFGLIFKNGIEIRGVGKKFWNRTSIPTGTELIIKKVRPKVEMAPRLNKPKLNKKKENGKQNE